VGELFDGSIAQAASYFAPQHLVFDFLFITVPWSAAAFRKAIATREAAFGPERWPTNVLSNHDQPRHASRFEVPGGSGVGGVGDARAKVAAAVLLTLRGTAFLYYAEEIAQRNLVVPNSEAFDPPARRASLLFRWWNRDQARGPMAWRGGPGGGFTTGKPWLPLPPDADVRNVRAQAADPESVLAWYGRLLRLRRDTPVLHAGAQELVEPGDRDVLAYIRRIDGAAGLVLLNFASRPAIIRVPVPTTGRTWRISLSTHPRGPDETLATSVTLAPLEALIATDS